MENGNDPQPSQAELGEVINDLQRGIDSASHLDMLIQDGSASNAQGLIQEIKGCFSRAMSTLNSSTQADHEFLNPIQLPYATNSHNTTIQSHSSRRNRPRVEGTGASQEKILVENPDDCYAWKICGQKEIQNSKYPRLCYRCAYKDVLNCCATKTVRRLEEHPSMYEIVYRGQHTCMQSSNGEYLQNSQLNNNSSSRNPYASTSGA